MGFDYNTKYKFIATEDSWWKTGTECVCEGLMAMTIPEKEEFTLEELNENKANITGFFRGTRLVEGDMEWEPQLGYNVGDEYEKCDVGGLDEFDIVPR